MFGLALLIVAALFGSVVPQVINETRQLALRIPAYAARVEKRAEYWLSHPPALVKRLLERESGAGSRHGSVTATNESTPAFPANGTASPPPEYQYPLAPRRRTGQARAATGNELAGPGPAQSRFLALRPVRRVASWFGMLAGMALIPVYTFYFLLEKRGISSRWTDYLPVADSGFKNELVFVLNSINNYLITFFRGQVLVAICDGILYGTGFLIIGLPYAVLIGAMAVFLTMIPYLGAIVTCFAALVIAFVQFGDWQHPLLVLAVFGVVQALEGLFISPRIMGGRVGLHPVTIIIAVMAGTTLLGGLLGGILAIPLTAALRVLMFRYVWKRPGRVKRET